MTEICLETLREERKCILNNEEYFVAKQHKEVGDQQQNSSVNPFSGRADALAHPHARQRKRAGHKCQQNNTGMRKPKVMPRFQTAPALAAVIIRFVDNVLTIRARV